MWQNCICESIYMKVHYKEKRHYKQLKHECEVDMVLISSQYSSMSLLHSVRAAKALMSLHFCAGSSEPLLLSYKIQGSNMFFYALTSAGPRGWC